MDWETARGRLKKTADARCCVHAHFDDFEFVAAGTVETPAPPLFAGFPRAACSSAPTRASFPPARRDGALRSPSSRRAPRSAVTSSNCCGARMAGRLSRRARRSEQRACLPRCGRRSASRAGLPVLSAVARGSVRWRASGSLDVAEAVRRDTYLKTRHAFLEEYPPTRRSALG